MGFFGCFQGWCATDKLDELRCVESSFIETDKHGVESRSVDTGQNVFQVFTDPFKPKSMEDKACWGKWSPACLVRARSKLEFKVKIFEGLLLVAASPLYSHVPKNQILIEEFHQGACWLILPGLHRIKSVSSHLGMLCKAAKDIHRWPLVNSSSFQSFSTANEPSKPKSIDIDDPRLERNDGCGRVMLEYDRSLDDGHNFERSI